MNCAPLCPVFAAGLLLASEALAQAPDKPPPWWGVNDNVTVSLYYSFNGPAPFQPSFEVHGGAWYNPAVTQFTVPPNLTVLPVFAGHTGVVALQGTGVPQAAQLSLKIDNDPYPDWIKLFTFQYEEFESASGSLAAQIRRTLAYKRAIIKETSEAIGGGWNRVTIEAQLIPQPTDEDVDWAFVESALGTSAIDNLFVNSKCVKPMPDENGDALGARQGTAHDFSSLGVLRGAAVTEGPAPAFQKNYWVARVGSTAGAQHTLLRVDSTPPFPTTLVVNLSSTTLSAPQGPGDLAVQTILVGGIVAQQIVWVVLDNRATGGGVLLQGVNANTGASTLLPLIGFPPLAAIPANQILGLAYDPSGATGAGTFMVSGTTQGGQGVMLEWSRTTGNLLNTYPIAPGCSGLGYDDTLGNFYGFSRAPQQTPGGLIETNGIEFSGYELDVLPLQFRPTGVRFCGDLTIFNGAAGPRGGSAAGFEVYRSRANLTAPLTMVCFVETPNNPAAQFWIYELAGPFGFGWSVLGRCGMHDVGPFHGVPFVGSTMEVTLTGVPNSLFATMFLGFSNQSFPGGPLPLDLSALLGWPESVLSVSPDVNTPLLLPSAPGEFSFPIPIPPAATLGYAQVFFQWLALDSSIPGFFAMSQAGKTVLYP